MSEATIKMELERWKGYSAYEVAKNNGFNGTEKEWLEQLGASMNITVNGRQVDDTGNITVTAEHILTVEEGQKTVQQKLEEKFEAADLVQDASVGGEDKPLSAAAGKALNAKTSKKAEVHIQEVTLPIASWEQDGEIYGQSVEVAGVTLDKSKTAVIASPVENRENEEAYVHAEVRASAQGDGVVVFTCTQVPLVDIAVNVMVVVLGVGE